MKSVFAAIAAVSVFLLSCLGSPAQATDEGLPAAEVFEKDQSRTWLSHCEFQHDRYIVCKHGAKPVIDAISNPEQPGAPGPALQAHVREIFERKGCTFAAPANTFRVNGIFLSFDAEKGAEIQCEGKPSTLVFTPQGASFLDTLYFYFQGPPQ